MSNNIHNSFSAHPSAKAQERTWSGQELCNTPLKKLNTWHIGGLAERLYYPISLLDLSLYLKSLENQFKITWLGLGSNVLISDEGLEGVVIITRHLDRLELVAPNCIYAQAGVTCAKLARFCALHNLQGGEFFAGIPGTVGGALAMNAGAFGGETWEHVSQVETINTQGEISLRSAAEFDVSYRTVVSKQGIQAEQATEGFVSGTFKFISNKDTKDLEQSAKIKIKNLLQQRNAKQPIGTLNCGSVFRNPPDDHAARLIEACDLKGLQLGGAIISRKHANFIINENNACSADIEKIIQVVQTTVFDRFSIWLKPEVKMLGKRTVELLGAHKDE